MAEDDDKVVLPLGLVALDWLRLYLPLVTAKLPQMPGNAGPDRLGFAGPGFRSLLGGLVPRLELRVSARFGGEAAAAVRAAVQEAADLIAKMPATYMTYPSGGPVLPVARRRAPPVSGEIVIDAAFLAGFGDARRAAHVVADLSPFRRLGGTGADCRMDPADARLRSPPGQGPGRGRAGGGDDLVGTVARRLAAA